MEVATLWQQAFLSGMERRDVLPLPVFSLFCGQSSGNRLSTNLHQPGGG